MKQGTETRKNHEECGNSSNRPKNYLLFWRNWLATGWTSQGMWFNSSQGQEINSIFKAFRPALGPTRGHLHWHWVVKLINYPILVPKLRKGDAKHELPHIPSRRAQVKHESLLSPGINIENTKKYTLETFLQILICYDTHKHLQQ